MPTGIAPTISSLLSELNTGDAQATVDHSAAGCENALLQRMRELVPGVRASWKRFREQYDEFPLGQYTVSQVLGGMRGMNGLITETSLLDEQEGILFRGLTIPDVQKQLPTFAAADGQQPLPEGILWLLLTGEVPSAAQVRAMSDELRTRATLPAHVLDTLAHMPVHMHAMTQLSSAVLSMQTESRVARACSAGEEGCNKNELWQYALEDALDLIARLPEVCARIFHRLRRREQLESGSRDCTCAAGESAAAHTCVATCTDDATVDTVIKNAQMATAADGSPLDWTGRFVAMLGGTCVFENATEAAEYLRLHLCIHSDHEGGNVCAHTTHLVGSTLSDPYLSFAAGVCGLAGPLHGLAAQETLVWINKLIAYAGGDACGITREKVVEFVQHTLRNGQVVPGYGHAVLRRTDPRFICMHEFGASHFPHDSYYQIVSLLYEVVPGVLARNAKIKNPWPNVDAHSGACLRHYNFTQPQFYTVLFGLSRALGVLSSLVLDRVLLLPIERPKSLNMAAIASQASACGYGGPDASDRHRQALNDQMSCANKLQLVTMKSMSIQTQSLTECPVQSQTPTPSALPAPLSLVECAGVRLAVVPTSFSTVSLGESARLSGSGLECSFASMSTRHGQAGAGRDSVDTASPSTATPSCSGSRMSLSPVNIQG